MPSVSATEHARAGGFCSEQEDIRTGPSIGHPVSRCSVAPGSGKSLPSRVQDPGDYSTDVQVSSGIIHRLRPILPQSALLTIYITSIQSVLDYCLTVYVNSSNSNRNKIQHIQNRAVRAVIGNFDFNTSVSGIISSLKLMRIEQRFNYFISILMYKCLNNMAPNYLSEMFIYLDQHQQYVTRNVSDALLLKPKYSYQRSFQYTGAQIWNKIPVTIRQSYSLNIFKRKIKSNITNFTNLQQPCIMLFVL